MTEPQLQVTTISSALEDTPEGMARMDRLREAAAARREVLEAMLSPAALARLDAVEDELLLGLPEGAE